MSMNKQSKAMIMDARHREVLVWLGKEDELTRRNV